MQIQLCSNNFVRLEYIYIKLGCAIKIDAQSHENFLKVKTFAAKILEQCDVIQGLRNAYLDIYGRSHRTVFSYPLKSSLLT